MFGRAKQRERRTAEALVSEISAQREATRELLTRFEDEAKVATSAVRAASRAREERDEYRRVLAAAIANERRQDKYVSELESQRKELEERAIEAARVSGSAEAARDGYRDRLASFEEQMREQVARHEKDLGDAADRAWAEREASRGEVVQLVTRSREEAAILADEVRRALKRLEGNPVAVAVAASPETPEITTRRLRGRLLVGLAIAAMLIGVALTPAAFLSAMDAERAAFVHLASGASPWQLIIATIVSFALAVILLGSARRDLRAMGVAE